MNNIATSAASSIMDLLTASAGTNFALAAIAEELGDGPAIPISSVLIGNTSPELFEQSTALKYPTVNIYCATLSNKLKEKFRVFSGTVSVVVELRHSQDRIQQIQTTLETYVAAACQILDASRGDLGNGLFYAGGYEVSFGPVKRGGRNFLQIAKVGLELDVSV
jgi:hypothetical protein